MEIAKEIIEKGKVTKEEKVEEIGRCLDCQRLFPCGALDEVCLVDADSLDRAEMVHLCKVCHSALKMRGRSQRPER